MDNKLDKYQIDLKGMQGATCTYDYRLDDSFFAEVGSSDVQKGEVSVRLLIRKTSQAFEFDFHAEGQVVVPCDRCLDEMSQPITSDDKLRVKFGSEYAEEEDNLVIVPEEEGIINVAWFMYEFIVLAIPMKHVHAAGECNEAMYAKLKSYLCTVSGEEEEEADADEDSDAGLSDKPIDPRWNELRKIFDNN